MGVSYRVPGLVVVEHEFSVPLDHGRPDGERIPVFAREVAAPDGRDRPFLVYFQGGPGNEAPRPVSKPLAPGWLARALRDYRVLLLDQRGTGRSAPFPGRAGEAGTALPGGSVEPAPLGDAQGTPEEQADYLACFRADSIVRDAELVRRELGVERWSVLGQSFGGFCVLAYLSTAPEGLAEAFLTGGLPGVAVPVDEIYRATYARMLERNRRYYERFPRDRERVRDLARRLDAEDVRLPSGDRLTPRRLRQLGLLLGRSGGAERLHHVVELPHDSRAFLHDVEAALPFARNPIYAVLHEACWADGGVTRWSAERMLPPEFEQPDAFTGEHVYPWLFEEYGELRPFAAAARLLAEREWPRLYDEERLAANEVPAAAAIYVDDVYVPREFSVQTAARVRGLRTWVTNEYEHDAIRVDGARLLARLIDLARGNE